MIGSDKLFILNVCQRLIRSCKDDLLGAQVIIRLVEKKLLQKKAVEVYCLRQTRGDFTKLIGSIYLLIDLSIYLPIYRLIYLSVYLCVFQ